MIYIEPAPYIVGFVEEVRAVWEGRVEVVYVEESHSQNWEYKIRTNDEFVLPKSFISSIVIIRRLLATRRYDLLHLAGWGHPILSASLLLAKSYRIPVAMESDTPRPPALSMWKHAVKRIVYPWLFSLSDVFLAGGTRQAIYLRDYGVDEKRIRIAQMTVDIEGIRSHKRRRRSGLKDLVRAKYQIPVDTVCILYLGRLEPRKGIADLLESYRIVSRSRPGLTLLVAGDGSLREVVRTAEAETASIRYLGRLSGDEVWEAYSAADIFILPSWIEPWGLVVNEAMAIGLPVIVSDQVGCADDIVIDGITGLVVPAKSPKQLAIAIAQLIDSPDLRSAMGRRARELISGWTLRNQADKTVMGWQATFD